MPLTMNASHKPSKSSGPSLDGQAVLVAYHIYAGQDGGVPQVPGVRKRGEFGTEIITALAYQHYVAGLPLVASNVPTSRMEQSACGSVRWRVLRGLAILSGVQTRLWSCRVRATRSSQPCAAANAHAGWHGGETCPARPYEICHSPFSFWTFSAPRNLLPVVTVHDIAKPRRSEVLRQGHG